ncbi:MAG TPA: TIGR02996 domain-containing protein [Kofleriaceae bacterium]
MADSVEYVAQHYPLTAEAIAEHADVLDWEALSRNTKVAWTEELLERYADRWDWDALMWNPALPWSEAFVLRYIASGRFNWSRLRWQGQLVRDEALVKLCFPHWAALPRAQWTAGSTEEHGAGPFAVVIGDWGPGSAEWAHRTVEEVPGLPWDFFSCLEGFPWTIGFIAKHAERLDWARLSWNAGLPWTPEFMHRFADRIEWDRAVYRIPWTAELLREFGDRIEWAHLPDDFPWTAELLESCATRVHWATPDMDIGGWEGTFSGVVNHPELEWTIERFERLGPHLEAFFARLFREDPDLGGDPDDEPGENDPYWTSYCDTSNWTPAFFDFVLELGARLGRETINWDQVSRHARMPWTDEFVARHAAELSIYYLLGNRYFPMARHLDALADRFDDNLWKWLRESENYAPTPENIARHGHRLGITAIPEPPKRGIVVVAPTGGRVDDDAIDKLLAARHMDREPALEAAIDASPNDPATYLRYAAWLTERGDPQGELISAMVHAPTAPETLALQASYFDRLEVGQVALLWRFGFVDEIYHLYQNWRGRLGVRPFRFLRGLSFTDSVARRLTPDDVAAIAKLTWLERLSLWETKLTRFDSLAALTALRDLRIDHAPVADLGFLGSLPALDHLGLWNTGITNLAPLASARGLVALHAGHNPVSDLGPLRSLDRLVELDVRYSQVADLSPLEGLPALRLLALDHSRVSDAERDRFHRVRPDVELTSYAGWPGSSTMLPFWDHTHRKPLDPVAQIARTSRSHDL